MVFILVMLRLLRIVLVKYLLEMRVEILKNLERLEARALKALLVPTVLLEARALKALKASLALLDQEPQALVAQVPLELLELLVLLVLLVLRVPLEQVPLVLQVPLVVFQLLHQMLLD